MPHVVMYTSASCPFCINAERLLLHRGVKQIDKIRVDLEPQLRLEMMEKTGRRTVPQIYIDERHIGGFQELCAMDMAGSLEALLAI